MALDVDLVPHLPEDARVLPLAEAAAGLAQGLQHFAGTPGAGASLLSSVLAESGRVVHVTCDQETNAKALSDLRYLQPSRRVLSLIAPEANPYSLTQPDRRAAMSRVATLAKLAAGQWDVLVVDADALIRRVVPKHAVRLGSKTVRCGDLLDLASFAQWLTSVGYLRVPVVEDPGTFAVRGGLLDLWVPDESTPCRLELFGDEVCEIRHFAPESQRTAEEVESVLVLPARETLLLPEFERRAVDELRRLCDGINYPSSKSRLLIEELTSGRQSFGALGFLPAFYELESLWSYLPADCKLVIEQPQLVLKSLRDSRQQAEDAFSAEVDPPRYPVESLLAELELLESELRSRRVALCAASFVRGTPTEPLEELELAPFDAPSLALADHGELERSVKEARKSRGKTAAMDPLVARLKAWETAGLSVTVVARANSQAQRLASMLEHRGVAAKLMLASDAAEERDQDLPGLTITTGELSRGVVALTAGRVLITEEEIFGQRARRRQAKASRRQRAALENLRALQPGDLVVHVEHGVGRYQGLQNRQAPGGVQLELLVIEYTGGKLFLPVYRLNQIEKHSGGEKPRIDRLGGLTFSKAKAKAKRKAREMADELLRLYAEREAAERPPLPPVDDEYTDFEAAFPYEETSDQASAISEVLADLERRRVMDRLVCGDVGFGKTEVALRATFRCVSAGRQVVVLCPTTVLAQQHFRTFSERFADYPVEVRALSRFQSKQQAADTLSRLQKGTVDIVVGTHRLLSKDVQFKSLGLLVIDEEQRFGVTHKERIKQLRSSVDVLTLTATPIPRTLQFALGGLREMSIINTPPADRRAIRTVVSRFEDSVVREAIERELSRGGQAFYVYNRVEGLYERAARLQALLPNAKIAVGHGQMKESSLERVMLDFVNGQYDVLVATSIVESGLDIPRANTMLIDRADRLGLAQLYQLRGRVGRSQERAYCYLLVPPPKEMNEEARQRIEALERYTELGSGFQIATLDMELRGGGDVLGAEQSGAVASVGLELFCRMLEEATRELQGEPPTHDIDPELNFDVEALLPDDYIEEVGVRLSLYKRLAGADDEAEVMQLAAEMEDRFGKAPPPALALVQLMRLKTELRRYKVTVCEAAGATVSLRFRQDTPIDPGALARMVADSSGAYKLSPDGRLSRKALSDEASLGSLVVAEKVLSELHTTLVAE